MGGFGSGRKAVRPRLGRLQARGMHWRNYSRLAATLWALEQEALELFIVENRRLLNRLEGKG